MTKPAKAAKAGAAVADLDARPLWFAPPADKQDRRRTLTRERVVAEALTVIAAHGVDALTMRALATRLGVVPAALYRHVRNKEQLHDLVLDGVLAEVDYQTESSLGWTEQITTLAHRLRTVLENHPGVAGLLKTRDPLGPHSLALTEAFLAPLHAAGLSAQHSRAGFLPALRLHPRLRRQHPHLHQRATGPGHRHQNQTPRVLPVATRRPLPHPGRPRRPRLDRQPRRTIHRRPRHHPQRAPNPAPPGLRSQHPNR